MARRHEMKEKIRPGRERKSLIVPWESMSSLILCYLWTSLALVVCQPMTAKDAKVILDKHNEYRRSESAANMYQLHWNITLQERAAGWAQKCRFEHERNLDIGENLYFNTEAGSGVFPRGMEMWHDEKKDWSYTSDFCGVACHYTQMVNAYTTTIGCSAEVCGSLRVGSSIFNDAMLFVCYYYPRGNFIDHFPFEHGAPCSKCAQGDTCSNQLCVTSGVESKTAPDSIKNLKPDKPFSPNRPIKELSSFKALLQTFSHSHSTSTSVSHTHSTHHRHHHHQHERHISHLGTSDRVEIIRSVRPVAQPQTQPRQHPWSHEKDEKEKLLKEREEEIKRNIALKKKEALRLKELREKEMQMRLREEREREEQERLERHRQEKEMERLEIERQERLERHRQEKEMERLEIERQERLERHRQEKEMERLEIERQERQYREWQHREKERKEFEREEFDRLERQRRERELVEKERKEKERQEREEKERQEREEAARLEKQRKENEYREWERQENERLEMEREERERLEKEKREKKRLENLRTENERTENRRLETERREQELPEKEQLENERKEHKEKEHLVKESGHLEISNVLSPNPQSNNSNPKSSPKHSNISGAQEHPAPQYSPYNQQQINAIASKATSGEAASNSSTNSLTAHPSPISRGTSTSTTTPTSSTNYKSSSSSKNRSSWEQNYLQEKDIPSPVVNNSSAPNNGLLSPVPLPLPSYNNQNTRQIHNDNEHYVHLRNTYRLGPVSRPTKTGSRLIATVVKIKGPSTSQNTNSKTSHKEKSDISSGNAARPDKSQSSNYIDYTSNETIDPSAPKNSRLRFKMTDRAIKRAKRRRRRLRRQMMARLKKKRHPHKDKFKFDHKGRRCVDRLSRCSTWVDKCGKSSVVAHSCPLSCGKCGHHLDIATALRNTSISDSMLFANLTHGVIDKSRKKKKSKPLRGPEPQALLLKPDIQENQDTKSLRQLRNRRLRRKKGKGRKGKRKNRTSKKRRRKHGNGLCRDNPGYIKTCRFWTKRGFCEDNFIVRNVHCRWSCGVCD